MINSKKLSSTLFILVMISPFILPADYIVADVDTPIDIHLSWKLNPLNSISINWRTPKDTLTYIRYGENDTLEDEELGVPGFSHHINLENLKQNTKYFYQVGNGEIWSQVLSFQTPTNNNISSFLVFGAGGLQNPERKILSSALSKVVCDFSLYTGEFVNESENPNQWYSWFKDFLGVLINKPMMACLGDEDGNSSFYYNLFEFPGNEKYYSFNYNNIHFTILDALLNETDVSFSDQIDWLLEDLQNNEKPWTIVLQHFPLFTSTEEFHLGKYLSLQSYLQPIFESSGVDIVISGHDHFYERLTNNNISYIITGGGGSPLEQINPIYIVNQSEFIKSIFHGMLIDVFDSQIFIRSFDTDLNIIDYYSLSKIKKADLKCLTLPQYYITNENEEITLNFTIANVGDLDINTETNAQIEFSNGDTKSFVIPSLKSQSMYNISLDWKSKIQEDDTFCRVLLDKDNAVEEIEEVNNFLIYIIRSGLNSFRFVNSLYFWLLVASVSVFVLVITTYKIRKSFV